MAYFAYYDEEVSVHAALVHTSAGRSSLEKTIETHELVRHIAVVLAGKLLADSALHKTRQRGQDIDRWVDLPVVQLTVDEDLALRDVTGKIWDRMRNICVG